MPAFSRKDKGSSPGTQTTLSAEGAVADGQMAIEVDLILSGSPAAVAADYATLAATSLTTAKTINWKKR